MTANLCFQSLSLDPKVRHRKVESSNYSGVSSTYCLYLSLSDTVKHLQCEWVILILSILCFPRVVLTYSTLQNVSLDEDFQTHFLIHHSCFKLLPAGLRSVTRTFFCFLWLTRPSDELATMLGSQIHKTWKGQLRNQSLTNLLELLFLTVLALPKASSSGLDCRMMSLTCCEETEAMSC